MGHERQRPERWQAWTAAAGPPALAALGVAVLAVPQDAGLYPLLAAMAGWILSAGLFMKWVGSLVRRWMSAEERAARDTFGRANVEDDLVLFRSPLGVHARRKALLAFALALVLLFIPALLPHAVAPVSFYAGCLLAVLVVSWICWTITTVPPPDLGTGDLASPQPAVGPPSPERDRVRRRIAAAALAAAVGAAAAKLAGADSQLTVAAAWNVLLLIWVASVLGPMVRRIWRRDARAKAPVP